MNLVRLIIAFAISINLTLQILGQSLEPGTQYFDDVRGDEIVVTNAWDNVSNRVHQLIQVVSPQTDISGKQDLLPYPTNAIPYSVITNVPTPSLIKDDISEIKSDGTIRFFKTRWTARSGSDTFYLHEEGDNKWVYISDSVSAELTWFSGTWKFDLGDGFNAFVPGNEDDTSLTVYFIDDSVWYLSKEGVVDESKLATTNTVAEMIATNKYSYITDGTNVIHSNLEYVRGGENKWVVKFTKDEYSDADFLPHEYSFELLLNQYGQWQNLNLGSEHTLWYQNNIWFLRVYFNTIDFGKLLILDDSTHGNENSDYVDFTNSYGHWECSRVLYKRDKIALVSESITNNTLRLPMTDSTTSERVYLKVENGEVNIYKVQ